MASDTELPAAPVVEKGYVNPYPGALMGYSGQFDLFEDVAELLWPYSIRTYTRMARSDTRVASLLQAISVALRTANWWIDPNGARPDVVKHVSTCLGLPIRGEDQSEPTPRTRGKSLWSQHLPLALKNLQYGHQIFERVYTYRPDDGRFHLERLSPRPSSTIATVDVARNGDLVAVQQWPIGTMTSSGGGGIGLGNGTRVIGTMPMTNPIPADRLVVYVRDPDPGVWFGNSILRPCYGNWMLKWELIRIEAAAARRHGIGVPKINVSAKESQDEKRMALYGAIAKGWTSGASSGVAFPDGTDAHIMGPEGNMPAGFIRQSIDYHDKQMALSVLMHFMNLDKGGSYALADSIKDPWVQSLQATANDTADTAQVEIVENIVDVNWGRDEPAPRIGCDQINQDSAVAILLQMLAQAGLITPDARLEAFLRTEAGLPPVDEATAEPPAPEPLPAEQGAQQAQARLRARGRSPKDRRKIPDGAMTLWD